MIYIDIEEALVKPRLLTEEEAEFVLQKSEIRDFDFIPSFGFTMMDYVFSEYDFNLFL